MHPTSPPRSSRTRRACRALVVGALLLAGVGVLTPPAEAQTSHTGPSINATAPTGEQLTAQVYDHPRYYTAEQLDALNEELFDDEDVNLGHPGKPPRHGALGPSVSAPDSVGTLATTVLRDSTIPASGISGGSTYASYTQEPSTDANGANIFQTGNWYATRSTDGGATWSYLDPFTMFGSGFCCDQVTQYDPDTGRQFWLLQFSDHLVLANASASGTGAFTNWCYWNITPGWFGLASGTGLDYNDMTIGNSYVYVSTNFFPSGGGSGSALARLPKKEMAACAGFNYGYLTRTDSFTFKLVPGSTDTLYWGSNWGQTNGSSFRVYAWPESSGSYSYWDRTVASYTFFTRNSGQNCASTDGVVTNWCQYADSRVLGAYRAAGVLGFSFNAKQDGSHPFPYSRIVWFNESDKSYIGAGDVWATWGAIQFLSLAPNSSGRVGGAYAWGGGTGGTHYYPGSAVYSTGAGTIENNSNFYLWGDGNTCTYNGLYRWGDYLTTRTYKANPSTWLATGWAIKGGNCGSSGAYAQPHNVQFSG